MTRALRHVLAIGIAAALLVPATASAFTADDLKGTWRGKLFQRGVDPFVVRAHVRSLTDADRNRVRYTGLGCKGTWTYLGRRGRTYRFRETITAGRSEICKGSGTVTLRPCSNDALRYVFRGGGVESRGVIRRI